MRHTQVQFLGPEQLELNCGADNPESLTLSRNGVELKQGDDYNVGDGDLKNFVTRFHNMPPWTRADNFTAAIDE